MQTTFVFRLLFFAGLLAFRFIYESMLLIKIAWLRRNNRPKQTCDYIDENQFITVHNERALVRRESNRSVYAKHKHTHILDTTHTHTNVCVPFSFVYVKSDAQRAIKLRLREHTLTWHFVALFHYIVQYLILVADLLVIP